MLTINIHTPESFPECPYTIADLVSFLHTHLGEFGDNPRSIRNAIEYAMSGVDKEKGYLLIAEVDDKLAGVVVMNTTGMDGYVPPNFLVYIAVDASYRGQGIGTKLMEKAIVESPGPISLHVEYDNPAKRLYERVGFTSKYAEMRLSKER